jgi:thiosulfate dehydrogenase
MPKAARADSNVSAVDSSIKLNNELAKPPSIFRLVIGGVAFVLVFLGGDWLGQHRLSSRVATGRHSETTNGAINPTSPSISKPREGAESSMDVFGPSITGTSWTQPTAGRLIAADKALPPGKLADVIRLGESLVNETNEHPLTKSFVGNALQCTSCHLNAGRHPDAGSFIGVAAAYPAYSPREERVITLEDRILNCFIRSQNGTRPKNGSEVPVAIAAYITWLSQDTPIEMNPDKPLGPNHMTLLAAPAVAPNVERGKELYQDRCAFCHADEGNGTEDGPPVWGNHSFNDGAGLAGVRKMASWLKVAMPLDDADLSDQDAFDIAAYVNSHTRPTFRPRPIP